MYESFFQKVELQKTWIELYKNSLHPKVSILEDLRFTTAWKVSKYGMNTGKYRPEKTPYFDTSHVVYAFTKWVSYSFKSIS